MALTRAWAVTEREIAAQIRVAAPAAASLAHSSLWVRAQGRIVYVEGCVAKPAQADAIEAFMRRLPQVRQVVLIVSSKAGGQPPYSLFAAPDKPAGTPRFSATG